MSDIDRATWLTLVEVVEWGQSRDQPELFRSFLVTLYDLCRSSRVRARGRRWTTRDAVQAIPASEWGDLWFDSDGQRFRSHDLRSGIEGRRAWTEIQFSRDDLIAHWPQTGGAAGEKALADQYRAKRDWALRRTEWRRQWIERFAGRQRVARQWIALPEIADWCARSVTGADAAAEERARTLAFQRLDQSARNGEFEREGTDRSPREGTIRPKQSKILYLDPLVTASGHTAGCRLTHEPLAQLLSIRDVAAGCWLPRELARQWLAAHGYSWPAHFEIGELLAERDQQKTSKQEITPEPPPQRRRGPIPKASKITEAGEALIAEGHVPAETISWGRFAELLWTKLGVKPGSRGYGRDTIQKSVRPLLEQRRNEANTENTES